MDIDGEIIWGVIIMTVLTVVFTGPGLWSENWDWMALFRKKKQPPPEQPK